MTNAEPAIVIASACPTRRSALGRLVEGRLGAPDREALERHLRACQNCQGYLEWLRAHGKATEELVLERERRQLDLDRVRRELEQQFSRVAAKDAAAALTDLALWHFARRENADPTIQVRNKPRRLHLVRETAAAALNRRDHPPWQGCRDSSTRVSETATPLFSHSGPTGHRDLARLAVDLAIAVDETYSRAVNMRLYLAREAAYVETRSAQADWEHLKRSPDPFYRAAAFSHEGAWYSIAKQDLQAALLIFHQARAIDPYNTDHIYNCWFLTLISDSPRNAQKAFNKLRESVAGLSPRLKAQKARRMRIGLDAAELDGHLRPPLYHRYSQALESLLDG
ncbi:MAG: hypothetical protein AB1486_14650 [Planctomycetota bacterium]